VFAHPQNQGELDDQSGIFVPACQNRSLLLALLQFLVLTYDGVFSNLFVVLRHPVSSLFAPVHKYLYKTT
jgi:hypothetical protein